MKMKQLQKMMKQAQAMQKQLEAELDNLTVQAASGGGMVSVTMDGKKNLKSVTIKPEAVDPDDVEMLEDLVLAAVNEACRKVDEATSSQLEGLGAGMLGQF